MGQQISSDACGMERRIRTVAGSYLDLEKHVCQANEWARLCPIPKTLQLRFRILLNEDEWSQECLPFIWELHDVVKIEAKTLRRYDESTVAEPRPLSMDQFYRIYCFLSDINDCSVAATQSIIADTHEDDAECQICMDQVKQVVLPCAHSFCQSCFHTWNAQNTSCPICRRDIPCALDDEVWQLTSWDQQDHAAHVIDLVARVYEVFDTKQHR
ncbi:hypothetical protein AeNC1_000654 [Aphanomyces euteiches]|nr:hypothetical protein AeNC1_000654 [Aphanomyces euteiches]